MGKNKLRKFSEMETFQHVFQPSFEEVFRNDYKLKGIWAKEVFDNDYPITLELGCGKGEYTVSLAQHFPERNFIGIDIKGARIWSGAKTAKELELANVGFVRTHIELIESLFGANEIDEIWVTFPDPQLKKRRNKKRLTGSRFLNHYRTFLKDNGIVNLKTDSDELYAYTRELVEFNGLEIVLATEDVYNSSCLTEVLSIKTTYEKMFLAEGSNINYIAFRLPSGKNIVEPSDDEE